jgi:DNA helicase HerA-like ATPase
MSGVRIPIGGGTYIAGRYANRHGLITGTTGGGKSITLMKLAEGFSDAGVSTFVVDAKGDLSALARSTPARFLDVFGELGQPARLSIERLGVELLARVLALSDAQAGVLDVLFAYAQARRLSVHSVADLNAIIRAVRGESEKVRHQFGHVTPTTLNAIGRAVLRLEREGARQAFDSHSFDFAQLFGERGDGTTIDGRGPVNILSAARLLRSTSLYGAFILYLLTDLFERMPEAGDLDRPRLVLFIDEAHLLFQDAAASLVQRVERIIRLIRSKAVGVYLVTQSPADIPPNIAGQLGNRIQHALRATTPADARAIRAAADSLPSNPRIDAAVAIGRLGVGECLVSTIGPSGEPNLVERVRVALPRCPLRVLAPEERPTAPVPAPALAATAGGPGGVTSALVVDPASQILAAFLVAAVLAGVGVVAVFHWRWALGALLGVLLFMWSCRRR